MTRFFDVTGLTSMGVSRGGRPTPQQDESDPSLCRYAFRIIRTRRAVRVPNLSPKTLGGFEIAFLRRRAILHSASRVKSDHLCGVALWRCRRPANETETPRNLTLSRRSPPSHGLQVTLVIATVEWRLRRPFNRM
jgi:hypothetical protein